MKIQVLSDLHIEHAPFTLVVRPDADVLVLAGDIIALENKCAKLYKLENLIKHIKIPSVMILGNHECYGFGKISETNKIIKSLETKYPNFHFLNNEVFTYKEVDFIGTTLWSDFDLAPNKIDFCEKIDQCINDFQTILSENFGLLTPREMIQMNHVARDFIASSVKKSTAKNRVVISHFVPTEKSISPQFIGNPLNPYFACNCENLMKGVHTFIHGHTHSAFDYMLNGTHIVCNPRGYPSESKNGFDSKKIIDV